jgi:hypothetical protein
LKSAKKLFPGFVALSPNQSSNDGIDTIFTHVIVVQFFGTNGLEFFTNVHLSTHSAGDNMIVYVHAAEYVCVVSAVRFSTSPSHRYTLYAFAKYLFIFKV